MQGVVSVYLDPKAGSNFCGLPEFTQLGAGANFLNRQDSRFYSP